MAIKTVLFDLDGTILNTNELIVSSFLYTLDYFYPGQYEREDVVPFIGPPLVVTFGQMTADEQQVEACIEMYRKHNHEHHDTMAKSFPQVKEVLSKLKEAGIQIGIVTSKLRSTVDMGIQLLGIESLLDVIVAVDDVKNPKPHPEPVLLAMEKLGAKKDETLMVGDYRSDIESGKGAGVKTAGVTWTWHGEDSLRQANPDYMLHEMKDLLKIVGIEDLNDA